MFNCPAMFNKDAYKCFHPHAYKPGVDFVHGNMTPRFGKHTNIPDGSGMIFVGLQYFLMSELVENWNESFFSQPKEKVVYEYMRVVEAMLGKIVETNHMSDLHDLGYLPIEIKALPEGSFVPYGVPCLTVDNTVAGFGWVTNMIETVLSAELWGMCTSATTAYAYRKRFEESPLPKEAIKFFGHDFSFRGMFGKVAAAMSSFGHLTSFVGSDTIPAALFAEKYYGAKIDFDPEKGEQMVFASVDATEHSVMCSYGPDGEKYSLEHLMTVVCPTGTLSIVCDTWDLFNLVTVYLEELKEIILARDGMVVVRPDSGDPVHILTGYKIGYVSAEGFQDDGEVFRVDGKFYHRKDLEINGYMDVFVDPQAVPLEDAEVKGVVECLWDIFEGEIDESTGLKCLDSHIGSIYGDSITLDRQDRIINRLVDKGFMPSVVLGIGSFTYQFVTRDTHGTAIKATNIVIEDEPIAIFKSPKTDPTKKSASGILMVIKDHNEEYSLVDNINKSLANSEANELKPVFRDGKILRTTTLEEIRSIIDATFEEV